MLAIAVFCRMRFWVIRWMREIARLWNDLPVNPDLVFVAEDETGITGFALVRTDHTEGPLLDSLHVDAARRGAGVGAMLLRTCAIRLQQLGHDGMWLEVLEKNAGARRFYARMGGVETEVFDEILVGYAVQTCKVLWNPLDKLTGS